MCFVGGGGGGLSQRVEEYGACLVYLNLCLRFGPHEGNGKNSLTRTGGCIPVVKGGAHHEITAFPRRKSFLFFISSITRHA